MRGIAIFAVAFLSGAIAPSRFSAQKEEPVRPELSAAIRSPEPAVGTKQNIRLEIRLENGGNESLLLWRSWGWGVGRTYVRVFDSAGKEVFTTFLADQIPPPPDKGDFIELKPHEFFGIQLDEAATHFVNVPGVYDILVEYTCPLSEEFIRKSVQLPRLPLWGRERGTIVSNKIRVEVTK